ncbi:alpha-amylase family glycosyl hydrolase [Marinomonas mediterranea]|uniref:Sucrose phosphorylase n=1 Tax=Marinomonas mediterranea (strain ATCC 700492 / JCM 21426 / NBRC 103028 / MMB-1) TaxID=717774 RepID=F2JVS9_MARM1|nr:alpha-amylase family glycosyl hydrolase [Marinomonas mediterranea]ADZ91715.1 Sucrose phosphorylase [Marinomonas mediterranea MMB-1]WCN17811.1 alpha-amylase [Marinomonas mediterranea MMB-1]
MDSSAPSHLEQRLTGHLQTLYPKLDASELARNCLTTFHLDANSEPPRPHKNLWDQSDIMLITYADTLRSEESTPLETLHKFVKNNLSESISAVHLLPFFPYSSDDGFSVMDYTTVNPSSGDWTNISNITKDFKVMGDLVINHCSSRSMWFENYKAGVSPGAEYFYETAPQSDLSNVVRPRTSPLLREVQTKNGIKHVWCTFSHDQIDLNFENPEVLLEFLRIIRLYLEKGIRWFRLDAVAFLWKTPGTNCINLPNTHEMIRLLRLMIEHWAPDSVIITETNIPNRENLTYFGNANEAHLIYNFSLPPLLINTLVTGNCSHLKSWLMGMPPAQQGTTYLNFVASHDGIGLRPTEGLLSEWEIDTLIGTMKKFGGKVSSRTTPEGEAKPYEINISLWNALSGSVLHGPDQWQFARFLCAAGVQMALEGVPAFYIHSLFGTENDHERVSNTGQFRSINRHIWQMEELEHALNTNTHHKKVFEAMSRLMKIRRAQAAFHPNATQYVLHMGDELFAFWRQSIDRRQSLFAVYNISDQPQTFNLSELNLIATEDWTDLVSDQRYEDQMAQVTLMPYQFMWLANKTTRPKD